MQQEMFEDREMLQSMIRMQKMAAVQYNGWANEIRDAALLFTFTHLLQEEHQIRFDLYQGGIKRGWYCPDSVPTEQVQELRQAITKPPE